MLTSVNIMAFFMVALGLAAFVASVSLTRKLSDPKLNELELIKDLLRKRADIAKGKAVYIFESERRIWLKNVKNYLNSTR